MPYADSFLYDSKYLLQTEYVHKFNLCVNEIVKACNLYIYIFFQQSVYIDLYKNIVCVNINIFSIYIYLYS